MRYGTCPTAAATVAKVATLSDTGASFSLETGAVVFIRFTYANSAASPTLNVNNTGAKPILRYGSTVPGTNANESWVADSVRCFIYDGSNWRLVSYGLTGNDNTVPQAYSTTAAETAAKTATCTNYNLLNNSYLMFLISTTNTAASALTLNVNSKGAKPIYINGTASSASNYTLPAGSYLTFYDGTNYYLRTDGKITGSITGDAATVNGHTVATDVPSGAKFTDTTYSAATKSAQGLMSAADKKAVDNSVRVFSRSDIGTAPNFDNPGVNGVFEVRNITETPNATGTRPLNGFLPMLSAKSSDNTVIMQLAASKSAGFFIRGHQAANVTLADVPWARIATSQDSGTGDNNGQVKIAGTNVSVKGLGSMAYKSNVSTQDLVRPDYLRGVNDNTLDAKISIVRANRLAFLPADQIIVEQTVDGGTTWTDAGVNDTSKRAVFSDIGGSIGIPRLNGRRNVKCGVRITFTAMKYNVPSGTAETAKYNYWSSTYVTAQERYVTLKELFFYVNAINDSIGVKLERASGANPNNWAVAYDNSAGYLTGWSGFNYIRFEQSRFGGGTNQTGQYWNYRLTFMTRGPNGAADVDSSTTSDAQSQGILMIRGYGDSVWGAPNQLMRQDHLYNFDVNQNATFPAQVTATTFAGSGASLTSLNGSNISSGTVAAARIADLAASKITSGTFDAARIPSLNASKIGSGTLAAARLPTMTGATASAAGTQGAVPAPAAGKQSQFLRGDGTWATPSGGGLWIDMGTISSLPVTKTADGVTADMVCAEATLGTPSAQRSDWTINTDTEGSITVSGTISGTTTLKIVLVPSNSLTAT